MGHEVDCTPRVACCSDKLHPVVTAEYHSISAATEDDGCSNASDICGETRDHTFVNLPNRYNTEPNIYTLFYFPCIFNVIC